MKKPVRIKDQWGSVEPLDVFAERSLAYKEWVSKRWYRRLMAWFREEGSTR